MSNPQSSHPGSHQGSPRAGSYEPGRYGRPEPYAPEPYGLSGPYVTAGADVLGPREAPQAPAEGTSTGYGYGAGVTHGYGDGAGPAHGYGDGAAAPYGYGDDTAAPYGYGDDTATAYGYGDGAATAYGRDDTAVVGAAAGVPYDTYRPAYEDRGPAGGRPAGRAAVPGDDGARGGKAAERPEGRRRLLPQALVVAFLAGGTSAFVASDKTVEISVDGQPRTLHTFADDVTELLADEGIAHGEHDIVAPAPGSPLASGDQVVVRYGRPVQLTLDGERRRVWTTARTVGGALRQLGVRGEGAYVSASRSARISRAGVRLDVRTERTVTLMADGRERTVRTNAATVREAVEEAGITLRGQDTTSVPPDSFPRDGQTVTVMRVRDSREVREERIPFRVRRIEDATVLKGTEIVSRPGVYGVRRVVYALRTVNGVRQKPRPISSEVLGEPVDQVVAVGTGRPPDSVEAADGLNWGALAACESGGRPDAVDSSGNYGGLYQFDTQTWQAQGGAGRPQDAPAAEQTYRAKKLFVQRGASPWPHCGRRLYG